MAFVPVLNIYLLLTWYQSGSTSNSTWKVYSGTTPAGPWTLVGTQTNNPSGYYNPVIMHRTVASNTRNNIIPLTLAYSGDYNNKPTYYFPTYSTMTLFTGGSTNPPNVVNFVTAGGSGAVSTFNSPNFVSTIGNLLVVGIRLPSATSNILSVKNAAGVSFTAIPGSAVTAAAQATELFYLPNITGSATDHATVTFNGTQAFTGMAVWEISGALTVSPLQTQANGINAGAGTTVTSGAFSTTQANEIICAMGGLPTLNNVYSLNNNYLMDSVGFPVGAGLAYCGAGHLFSTAILTGSTETLTGTVSGSGSTISLAVFKAAFYNITGNAGVAGAVVSFSGTSSGVVVADGSGNYSISGLAPGTYTITPSLVGYTFNPTSSPLQTIVTLDISGVNFIATAVPTGGGGLAGGYRLTFGF
jgi:hypothetical protein